MDKEKLKSKPPQKENRKQIQQPKKQVKENSFAYLAGLFVIILLGIIIYSNSFNCSFHFDDFPNIVDNVTIQNLSDITALWNYSQTRFVAYYTFAINYHFGKFNVWGYHFFNLVIHLINACLVWRLTWLIFSTPALKENSIIKHKKVIAFLMALLFVSHPLATQSVIYIVQRMASLAAMFYLLSLVFYVKGRLSGKENISQYMLFAGSFISAVLAMLTKENAFTLPFVIVLFEIFFLSEKKLSINFKGSRFILLTAAFMSMMIIVLFKFSFSIFNPIIASHGNGYVITSQNYFFTQFSVIVKYIQLLFLPINQNLDYDFPLSNNFFETRTLLCLLFLLSLLTLAIFLFKRYKVISFGIFWFFITLSVESSFIPIEDVIFEHRTYLPSFGFFLILSSGIYYVLWNKYKYITIAVLLLIVISNSVLTYERNKVWKDDFSLWNDIAEKSPNSARSIFSRGIEYEKIGQLEKALADYTNAMRINPNYLEPYYNRGNIYSKLGQLDKAIADYSRAIEIDPTYVFPYYNRGFVYSNLLQWDKALDDFSKTIELDPKYAKAYGNRGVAYHNLGQWEKAIADYSMAIELDPNYTTAYSNREIAYRKLNSGRK